MDPNATLAAIRINISDYFSTDSAEDQEQHAERIIELVEALDSWMTTGGFLPTDWAKR